MYIFLDIKLSVSWYAEKSIDINIFLKTLYNDGIILHGKCFVSDNEAFQLGMIWLV